MTSAGIQALRTITLVALLTAGATGVSAHPGGSIVVDRQGQVYFVDTGAGVWKIDLQGKSTLIHTVAYHWMALDETGHFAKSTALGESDGGTFERITPPGALPALIISSDYPIAVGADGGLYYVPYAPSGPRQLIRRTPDGRRSVFATLPIAQGPKPMQWVNGIVNGPDGSLYIADNDAVRKIDRSGKVSTVRDGITADCPTPLSDTPKLPYLRGLAISADGTIYAAANGCRSVIAIQAQGPIRTLLKAEPPWSPTAVALSGKDVYVLEYVHTPADDRKEWNPRVRQIGADGTIKTVITVQRH
jgi:hypothetical protein